MVAGIGRSTSPSTATHRDDVSGNQPASFRYNNPGAQYPSSEAAKFGQTGYGIIGGGHKIARFPSPVNGAAANFDLLYRKYTGMTIGAAGTKWTGAHGFGVPGYNPNSILTKQMLDHQDQAIALLKAIAHRESGRGNNLSEEQWRQAHRMFIAGGADAYLGTLPADNRPEAPPGQKTGAGLLKRAREHIGEEYLNILVPKDDPTWHGPWDCAEFMSWLVYQEAGIIYGCTDDEAPPSEADAYTGAWKRDAKRLGRLVSVDEAAATVGAIVLRYPPGPGSMGHIALCDGQGGTVEAKGRRYGVVADTIHGRNWDTGVLVPGITYDSGHAIKVIAPELVYEPGAANMNKAIVVNIQEALVAKGFNPGTIDGDYGPNTQAAVAAFQEAEGLVVDGAVGPETAAALGVSLVDEGIPALQEADVLQHEVASADLEQLRTLVLALLAKEKTMAGESIKPAQGGDPATVLLMLLLQSLLSGKQIDTTELLAALSGGKPGAIPAPAPQPSQPPQAGQLNPDDIKKFIDTITTLAGGAGKLGPVNGALGQTIGELVNGKKTALGIGGSLATTLLAQWPALSGPLSAALGLGGTAVAPFMLPIFLAITGWGVLGKMEKWTQTVAAKP